MRGPPTELVAAPQTPTAGGSSGPQDVTPWESDGRSRLLTAVALLILVGTGTAMRVQGLTSLGFYRDDAWAAMSSRVGLGTAWHMWVTAPGFSFLERSFIGLGPATTWWAQIPPLLAGIAAIPAMYLLARHVGFHRVAGLVLALLVCVSPVCVVYSSRVKEYGTAFLVACAVLWVAESARRRPDGTRLLILAAVSVLAFAVSASLGPVLAGVWLAVAISAVGQRRLRWDVVAVAVVVIGACGAVAAIFYSHLSPALSKFWGLNYITHGSAAQFLSTSGRVLWDVYAQLLNLTAVTSVVRLVLLVLLLGLSFLGAYRNAAMLGPACVVVVAACASAAHVAPLGTGRTDEYLYPALLLLLGAGAVRLWVGLRARLSPERLRVAGSAIAVMALLVAGVLIGDAIATTPSYPGVGVQALVAKLQRTAEPTDHIVVGELTRYPWAYYEDRPLRLRFGPDWSTNFTVVSTDPDVFIVPSEFYEGGSEPARWARAMQGFHRLWFVESPPLSLNPTYAALVHDGWHPVRRLTAPGCAAILLER
jgi:hypothetical protein